MLKYFLIMIVFIITIVSCDVTENIKKDKINEPGRRDYVWNIDTIDTPMGALYSIWGNAPDDIWVVGASPTVYGSGIWHYDGVNWSAFKTPFPYWSSKCIFGFGKNDIWVGYGSQIYHYEGNEWVLSFSYPEAQNGFSSVIIKDLWGTSSNNIYALAYAFIEGSNYNTRSIVLHYDGSKWEELFKNNSPIQYLAMREYKKDLYIYGVTTRFHIDDKDSLLVYKYSDKKLTQLYCGLEKLYYSYDLELINDELYLMIGRRLIKLEGGEFQDVLYFNQPNYGFYVCGRHEKDMFIYLEDGIAHYNGTDIENIYDFGKRTFMLRAPVILEKDIFILGAEYTGTKNFIIHGRLKDEKN